MKHGGTRRGAGRKPTGKKGKLLSFYCHEKNIKAAKKLQSENKLSRSINEFLAKK